MSEDNQEISLRELSNNIRDWVRYLRSKWLIIIGFGILGSIVGIIYSIRSKPTYEGALTFVLSNDSKVSGFANFAGQLGLDVGNNGSSGAFDGDNIMELLKSGKIVKGAMFKKLPGTDALLINRIGEIFNFFEGWTTDMRLKSLIPFKGNADSLSPVQDSLVNIMYGFIMKNMVSIAKTDKKLSFYSVTTTSHDDIASVFLTKYLVEEAARLYIDTKTKVAKDNLNMLTKEADSLRNLLGHNISLAAKSGDATFNLNSAIQVQRAGIQKTQFEIQVLATAYAEVVKNLEIAKITLQKETPLYQVIDEPRLPLTKKKFGKLKGLIVGGSFFGMMTILGLILKRIINQSVL